METIRKRVGLEQTKNRYINLKIDALASDPVEEHLNRLFYYRDNKYFTDDRPWGGECVDILVKRYLSVSELKTKYKWVNTLYEATDADRKLPMTLQGDSLYIRYKNLYAYYNWVMKTFVPSVVFYEVCNGRLKPDTTVVFNTRTEDSSQPFFSNYYIEFFATVPDPSEVIDRLGTVIGVSEHYDEAIERFSSLELMGEFVIFFNYLLNHGFHSEKNEFGEEINEMVTPDIKPQTPFVDIPLCLTHETVDLGVFHPVIETWVPKKRYYLGSVVYYEGETYMLNRADDYEVSYVNGSFGEVFERARTANVIKFDDDFTHNYVIVNGKDELPEVFVYNEMAQTTSTSAKMIDYMRAQHNTYILKEEGQNYGVVLPYFCGTYNPNTRLTEFNKDGKYWCRIQYPFFYKNGNRDAQSYSATVSTKLTAFKRKKSSRDDRTGDILPFIAHYEEMGSGTTAQMILMPPETELEYMPSQNIDETNGAVNTLIKMEFYSNDNTITPLAVFDTQDEPILYSQIPEEAEIIKFTYELGRREGYTTGLTYEERYYFSHDTINNVEMDGISGLTFEFANVNYSYSLLNIPDNADIDLLQKNPIYSKVTVSQGDILVDKTDYAPLYKNEALIGVQDIDNEIDAYIRRGTGAAMERHQILGEIKTMQDMQNFRNNYFEI